MDTIKYKTRGVCSREIEFSIDEGILRDVKFRAGCNGNLQALSRLVEGLSVDDVISKLRGINCEGRGTSCADQLVKALESYKNKI